MKILTLIPLLFSFYTVNVSAAQLFVDIIPGGDISSTYSTLTGGNFDVDIVLNDAIDFAGFEFNMGFDSTILSATSITSGNVFGVDTFTLDDTISSSNISFSEASLALTGLNINTPTVIASFSFSALASGTSNLSLANVILSDSFGLELIPVNLASGAVTVVPVPAAFWLFFTGMIGMLRVVKRKV